MEKTSDLVSVYIPSKNRRLLLERAVNSVLAQDYTNLEILIVNDGSTDDTEIYLQQLAATDDRVTVINNELSIGSQKSRNLAISSATGKYVTGLDDDDEMLPSCISTLVSHFDPKWSFVCGNCRIFSPGVKPVDKTDQGVLDMDALLYYNYVGNQVLTTKERWLGAGGFSNEMKASQDYDTWIRLVKEYGACYKVPQVLYNVYKSHGETISASPNKVIGMTQFLEKHRSKMSPSHIKAQEFEIVLTTKEQVSLCRLVQFLTPKHWKGPVRYYFSQFSFLQKIRTIFK